jgi:hypothetical protein
MSAKDNTGEWVVPTVLQPIDIAATFGVSPFTAQRMCRLGVFPNAFRLGEVGSRWRVPIEDLDAFIQRRREETVKHCPVPVSLPPTEVW